MSTPQNILYSLQSKVNDLCKKFQAEDENEKDIFESVKDINTEIRVMNDRIDKLEAALSLIIKLLTKTEK